MIPNVSQFLVKGKAVKFFRSRSKILWQGRDIHYIPILLLPIICILIGCTQKELLYPSETCRLDVHFLWDKAEKGDPEGMTLLFYPEEEDGELSLISST